MGRVFLFIAAFLITQERLLCQSTAIKGADSVRVVALYKKAFTSDLFSQVRQAYLDSILMIRRDQSYAWQQKSMPLFKQKKYELAMPFLDSAVKYDPSYQWLEYRSFMKCIFQKSYRAALVDLRASEKRNPGGIVMDHSYDFFSGLCYLQLNRFDSAEFYFRRSIRDGVKRMGYGHHLEYLYLGIVQFEKGWYKAAILSFDEALLHYQRFSDAKYYKALCLKKLDRAPEAQLLLKEAAADLKIGYTINEDNVIYEEWPYQLKKYWLTTLQEKPSVSTD
jgi:tetratricopeptide (TPR) repeat protein